MNCTNLNLFLGDRIRKLRNEKMMSQLDLELMIGASHGCISRIESGKVNPSKETLINIARAMNLEKYEILYLFGLEE